jgi:dsRNA-specific ribonuclease
MDESNDGIFNPYNPLNKEITLRNLQCILKTYGLPEKIFNIKLYQRAFVHSSYVKRPKAENELNDVTLAPKPLNCLQLKTKSNERLEFLGDGILEAITKFYLYSRFPKENEGFMTEKKIALVKNEAIGKIAYQMGLHKWMVISRHAEDKNIRTNVKKLGCLFEAFLGAVFLDFNKLEIDDIDNYFKNVFLIGPGFQMAQIFIQNIFEKHVNWIELLKTDDNYKNILQVLIQKKFKITPEYIELSRDQFLDLSSDSLKESLSNNENNEDQNYYMGVYICFNAKIYNCNHLKPLYLSSMQSLDNIEKYVNGHDVSQPIIILLGTGYNKTKKKAEQIACKYALDILKN